MRYRSHVLLLAAGLGAGYLAAGRPAATAQNALVPFAIGDRVIVRFAAANVADEDCTIAAIHGTFAKCGRPSRVGGSDRQETWINLHFAARLLQRAER